MSTPGPSSFTWTPGGVDISWNDAGNWSPKRVPGIGLDTGADIAVFAGSQSVSIFMVPSNPDYLVASLAVVGNGGKTADIYAGNVLTVTGLVSLNDASYLEAGTGIFGTAATPDTTTTLSLANGSDLSVVLGNLTVFGRMEAVGSTIEVGAAYGSGWFAGDTTQDSNTHWSLANGASVSFSGLVAGSGDTFSFDEQSSASTLTFGTQGDGFAGKIDHLTFGDTIDLTQLAYNPDIQIYDEGGNTYVLANGALYSAYAVATPFTFSSLGLLDGGFASALALRPDGQGGTEVKVVPIATWTDATGTHSWTDAANWLSDGGIPGNGIDAGAAVVIRSIGTATDVAIQNNWTISLTSLTVLGNPGVETFLSEETTTGYGDGLYVAGLTTIQQAWFQELGTGVFGTAGVSDQTTTLALSDARVWVYGDMTVYGQIFAQNTAIDITGGIGAGVGDGSGTFTGGSTNDVATIWRLWSTGDINASASFKGYVTGGDTFEFEETHGTLSFGFQPVSFDGAITGFGSQDTIDLTELAYEPGDTISGSSGGAWAILRSDGSTAFQFASLTLSGQAHGLFLQSDGHGGTAVMSATGVGWTGAGDGTNWDDPANWTPAGVPGTDAQANAYATIVTDTTGGIWILSLPSFST